MCVLNCVKNRKLEVETRLHCLVILLESVHKARVFLSHKYSEPKVNVACLEEGGVGETL